MLKTDRRQIYNYLDYHCITHRIVSQTALCWCPRKIPIVFESIAGWKTITLRSSLRYLRLSHIESGWVILIDRDLVDGIWSLELGAREERLSFGIWERQNGRKWTVEPICHHGKVVSRDIPQLMEQKYYEYTLRNPKWRWRDWLWQNALSVMVLRVPNASPIVYLLPSVCRRLSRGCCEACGKLPFIVLFELGLSSNNMCWHLWDWEEIGLQLQYTYGGT